MISAGDKLFAQKAGAENRNEGKLRCELDAGSMAATAGMMTTKVIG